MRNLTIQRTKSFVGCLAKMKIYIEDPTAPETYINNIPCRELGDLKNGEAKTFSVGEQATKVFVIADQLSKGFCNEYYPLPEGTEDIFLSGKNKYNLANGNAFRFDNNESVEVQINRKRGSRKGLVVLLIAAVLGAVVGCISSLGLFADKEPEAKTFSTEGMSVTLTEAFQKSEAEGYTATFESRDVVCFALKEPFSLGEGFEDYSIEEYTGFVLEANGLTGSEISMETGIPHFAYNFTNPETQDVLTYFSYTYKSGDAFWLVQFATFEENADKYAAQIEAWAKSVEFSE